MSRASALLPVLFASALSAQVRMPATSHVDLAQLKGIAAHHTDAAELTKATEGRYPTALVHGRCMVGFLGKVEQGFDAAAVEEGDVHIGARKGNILSFRVDAQHLEALQGIPGLEYAELAGKVKPTLDKVIKNMRVDSVWRGINLPQTYTGRNVLIGITDWGFDYTQPMFYDTNLTHTRIRAAWDQFRQAGPAPAAHGYGTEMTTVDQLMAAGSDTVNIYGHATHGSHVAGICGGSGAGTIYRGVAFDANYLFCTFLVDGAAVLDAFDWMQTIAAQDDERLVINMSWGLYWIGTLDGHSLLSQAIDQMSSEGVVFVNSGGNNGDVDFHIKKTFAGDTLRSRIQVYPYTANPNMWGQSISMWGEAGEAFAAGLMVTTNNNSNTVLQQTPWYHTATQQAYLDSFLVYEGDTVFFNLTAEAAHPLNGRPYFRLRVKNTNTSLRVALKATAEEGTVHFWNVTELTNDVGNWGQAFQASSGSDWTAGDRLYGIGEPACTESLITVAAYASEYMVGSTAVGGDIAGFSSSGPTLDERMKPDITAPGVSVVSSISSFTDNDYTPFTSITFDGRTYPFAKFSGTSMSAPAVTGVVALMLEADPTLTPADAKDIIQRTARTDSHTGVIPPGGSTRWGMGKINAYHAVAEALGVTGIAEQERPRLLLWPDPAVTEVLVRPPFSGQVMRLTVTDATGRTVLTRTENGPDLVRFNVARWPAGLYLLRLEADGRLLSGRFIKE